MTLRAASDLVTYLKANIVMANITALTNKPIIQLRGGEDTTGDKDSGELKMIKEIVVEIPVNSSFRHLRYTIDATYYYEGDSETTFKQMVEEFDRTLRAANKSFPRAYKYKMDWDWDTNLKQSVAIIIFTLIKEYDAL